MYWKRIFFLLTVAIGTIALAASIAKYQPHLNGARSPQGSGEYTVTMPNGGQATISPKQVERIIRQSNAPIRLPRAAPEALHAYLLKIIFSNLPPSVLITQRQNDAILLVTGVVIPNTKDQRILTYVSDDQAFVLVDDFIRPATESLDGIRIERGQLTYSDNGKDLYSKPLELPPIAP